MDMEILVPAARTFVVEVNRAYPGRGTGSDGSVASSGHHAANPNSDHEPGPAGSPSPGKVDAVDLDKDLVPGDPVASERAMYGDVIPAFQRHPGTQYWIFNDQICHRSEGWQPRSYDYAGPGRNRHTEHAHLNWQETAAAHGNVTRYGIKGAGTDVDLTDKVGNPTYPTRTFRQFINDLWVVRDNLAGDKKAPPYSAGSPLGRLLALPAKFDAYVARKPVPAPVILDDATRAALVAEVVTALRAQLPELVRAALSDIEYAPRKSTP